MAHFQVLSLAVRERLGIEGLKGLSVPLHLHLGHLVLQGLQTKKSTSVLRVPPPDVFMYTLKALELDSELENRYRKLFSVHKYL